MQNFLQAQRLQYKILYISLEIEKKKRRQKPDKYFNIVIGVSKVGYCFNHSPQKTSN